jgi:hypothetical protein
MKTPCPSSGSARGRGYSTFRAAARQCASTSPQPMCFSLNALENAILSCVETAKRVRIATKAVLVLGSWVRDSHSNWWRKLHR